MNAYEILLDNAYNDGLLVKEKPLQGSDGRIKGSKIAIRENMTIPEKTCTLAEELGHHYTTYGNIMEQSDTANRKQEFRARAWAYNKQIGLLGLIRAYEYGCQNRFEIADYLEVTESVLEECISCYRKKYGVYKIVGNYIIYFIPTLAVFKRI